MSESSRFAPEALPEAAAKFPLCVDLDGTVIRTDTLVEAFLRLLKRRPLAALLAPLSLLKGKAALKRGIAERIKLDPAILPYNHDVLDWLTSRKLEGRRLVLATASDEEWAQAIAGHLGLFEQVIASNGHENL